jgi:hypothetical protein
VISPLQDAHEFARAGAINEARRISEDASLYDVRMEVHESERYQSTYITCSLLGSLVRRARPASPVARPVPTVSLAS